MPVTAENIEGAASLIIWTITSIVMIKYALIVLRADDNGQGVNGNPTLSYFYPLHSDFQHADCQ